MFRVLLGVVALTVAALPACGETAPEVDVEATVEAQVTARLDAQATIQAAIDAGIRATVEAGLPPTPMPVPTATNTPMPVPTATGTPMPVPTATNTPMPVPTATNTPMPVPTATNTPMPVPTATNTPMPVPTATNTPMPAPTRAPEVPQAMVPPSCVVLGDVVTDCPLRSPHVWKPARQPAPGEVWLFQDYDGPRPTQFFESPHSAQMVRQGLFPPLEDRLPVPEDVEVIAGPDGIGEYGGIYRQVQPHSYIGEWILASWNRRDSLGGLRWFPWIGKGWDVSDDGRVWTFTMREGLKWGDGVPLDMESVEFAWEVNLTPSLFGGPLPLEYSDPVTENPPRFEVVDDLTWTLTYDSPIFTIMEARSTPSTLCSPGRVCIVWHPDMKRLYPQYAGQAAVDQIIRDGGYTDLLDMLRGELAFWDNIDSNPCAAPYCNVEETAFHGLFMKNQYHWFVDPEGNQIPYTDGAVMRKYDGGREVILFRAMAGEEDGRTSTFIPGELPIYARNMGIGDYSIYLWPSTGGADLTTTMQQTYNEDPRIGELIRTQDFRLALSATVDKNDLKSVVLSGIGVVQNRVPLPNNPYYPGDEYRLLHMEKDLAKANQLLDDLNLHIRDEEGYRMHRDGSGTIEMQITVGNDPNPAVAQAAEILRNGWESVGIKTTVAAVQQTTRDSLQTTGISRDYSAYQYNPWMVQWTSLAPLTRGDLAGEIGKWYASKGEEGMAPTGPDPDWLPLAGTGEFPADPGGLLMGQSRLWIDGLGVSNLDPRRVEIGKEMFATNADQLWGLNCCAYSGVFRGVFITRNNFRNKPITHERDHNGFTAWARFFEDGRDNFHNPNNRSQYCSSWVFTEGGSPYDKCTKTVW